MEPKKESIIYEDEKLYVCLASIPKTKGHTVVVWKGHVEDLRSLSCDSFQYLLNIVDVTRDTLLDFFAVQKVYLVYMDEAEDVHWHLIPRYEQVGFDVFCKEGVEENDMSLVEKIKDVFHKNKKIHKVDFE